MKQQPIDIKEVLALLGAKELELGLLRQRIAALETALVEKGRQSQGDDLGSLPSPGSHIE